MPLSFIIPDWRDPDAYAGLLTSDRSALAWEWLRRNPDYCGEAERALGAKSPEADRGAATWGVHRFERPEMPSGEARPIWRAERHVLVLGAHAVASKDDGDSLLVSRFAEFATVVTDGDTQHLLLSDGSQNIRLDVSGVCVDEGPIRFHYALSGLASLAAPLAVLDRLHRFARSGRFDEIPGRSKARNRRLVLTLRAWDGLLSGANQREIAATLLHSEAAHPRWRIETPSLRSQAQRLVQSATSMAAGGFWELLR